MWIVYIWIMSVSLENVQNWKQYVVILYVIVYVVVFLLGSWPEEIIKNIINICSEYLFTKNHNT